MRSREDVLREFQIAPNAFGVYGHPTPQEAVEKMADRIRELEAPRGEAVAWACFVDGDLWELEHDKRYADAFLENGDGHALRTVRPLVFGDAAPVAAVVSEAASRVLDIALRWETNRDLESTLANAVCEYDAALAAARGGG